MHPTNHLLFIVFVEKKQNCCFKQRLFFSETVHFVLSYLAKRHLCLTFCVFWSLFFFSLPLAVSFFFFFFSSTTPTPTPVRLINTGAGDYYVLEIFMGMKVLFHSGVWTVCGVCLFLISVRVGGGSLPTLEWSTREHGTRTCLEHALLCTDVRACVICVHETSDKDVGGNETLSRAHILGSWKNPTSCS